MVHPRLPETVVWVPGGVPGQTGPRKCVGGHALFGWDQSFSNKRCFGQCVNLAAISNILTHEYVNLAIISNVLVHEYVNLAAISNVLVNDYVSFGFSISTVYPSK